MAKNKVVKVVWEDSYGCSSSWETINPHKDLKAFCCVSYGILAYESDEAICIVPHYADADEDLGIEAQGCGDMTIPKKSIVRITELCEREHDRKMD